MNKKYEHLVFTFLMAFGMSCIISFSMMLINNGLHAISLLKWLKSWSLSFVIAFPAAYYLPMGIRKLMRKMTFVESN